MFSFSTVSEDDPCCLMLFSLVVLQPIDAKGWNFLLYNCSQLPVLIAPGRSSLRQARAFDAERESVSRLPGHLLVPFNFESKRVWVYRNQGKAERQGERRAR